MTRLASRLLAALLLAAAVGCGEKSSPRLSEQQLARLVLQPADLPEGLTQFDEGPQTRLDAHPGPRRDSQRFGRQDGWKARYRLADTKQPLIVESRADVFATAGGARDDLDAYADEFAANAASGWRDVPVPKVGDGARAWAILQGTPKSGYRVFIVAWRHGRMTASVTLSGIGHSTSLRGAVGFARKQDAHLAAAA